jgi:tetratricopeptide (TPR) repeat protein
MGERRYEDALSEMRRLQPANDFERAMLLQTEGFIALGRDEPQAAEAAFEAAVGLDVLPDTVHQGLMYSISTLQFQRGDFEACRATLLRWFQQEAEPQPEAHVLMAAALAELGDFAGSLTWIDQALARRPSPPENWLQLKLAVLYELGDHRTAISLLEELIARRPDRTVYWESLWASQLQLDEDARALATMKTAHGLGLLTSADQILGLGRLMIYLEVPAEAARMLEEALADGRLAPDRRSLELLVAAHTGAREIDAAVAVLDTLAAQADHGRDALKAANLLAGRGRWSEAMEAAERAVRLGGLPEPGQAWLLLGLAAAEAGQPDRAIPALRQAREGGGALRRSADSWLAALDARSVPGASTGR